MRMLMLHVDMFSSTITEKGRSKIVEDYSPDSKTTSVNEALIIFTSVEKQDEPSPWDISENAVDEIAKLAQKLKVDTIVIHPFAHLFGNLSRPEIAVETLRYTEEKLVKRGFKVIRTPFG